MKPRAKIKNKKRIVLPVTGEGGRFPNVDINNSVALADLMEEKFRAKTAKLAKR